ncbi:hypothetical protein HDV01_006383 [Terramyces sp. JEL0728]|nr:hypothetical protein HDV01_006383 [Terramyces sp. JEL0728]
MNLGDEPWNQIEQPWEMEQKIERELQSEMEILREVEGESLPPTNVFEKATRSSVAFDPETPKKRKSIVPSSPISGSSPLYSNLQPTPVPSDFDIFNKKVKVNADSQMSASSFGSLENKTGLYFESDDDDEIQNSFKKIIDNFTPNNFGFESDDDEPTNFKSKLESLNYNLDTEKLNANQTDYVECFADRNEQSTSRGSEGAATMLFQKSLGAERDNVQPRLSAKLQQNYAVEPREPYMKAVTSNGTVLYFPIKKKQPTSRTKYCGNILSQNIATLMEKAREQLRYDETTRKMNEMSRGRLNVQETDSDNRLWVDKYRPKMYIDLVGDEYLNRSILAWVKHWDYCVFGKDLKKSLLNVGKAKNHPKFEKPMDKLQRPDKRILLLAGPPGLGKTTLAHIVAKHAGYNIIEVNASDDRGSEVIKNRITSAIESKSVFGNKKPSLVIIDEIDGASASGSGDQPPVHLSLAKRLLEICNWEGLKASLQTMLTLCEMTKGDMRSSINTLQFIKQNSPTVTEKELLSARVGNKDISESWYKVAEAIFSQGDPKRKAATDLDKYTLRLKSLIDANGDPDKLLHAGKSRESRYVQQAGYLQFFDSLQRGIWKDQRYELNEYLAYPIINFYRLFATSTPVSLEFPNNSYHCEVSRKQTRSVEHSFHTGMSPHIRCFWSNHTLNILELGPYLANIIAPNFRPANIQVLRAHEKKMLERLIQICIDFGIRLIKQSLENNTLVYITEPALHLLIDIEPFSKSRRSIASFPYAISNFISNQIEHEAIRRNNDIKNAKVVEPERSFVSSSRSVIESQKALSELISTNIQKSKLKTEKPSKDFFGRVINPQLGSSNKVGKTGLDKKKSKGILYKFNEGYSNAVRKPFYVKDLQKYIK